MPARVDEEDWRRMWTSSGGKVDDAAKVPGRQTRRFQGGERTLTRRTKWRPKAGVGDADRRSMSRAGKGR